MAKYHRAKKEDEVLPSTQTITEHIGSVSDSFPVLQTMCNNHSIQLQKKLKITEGEIVKVIYWTSDIPELIGISTFRKATTGEISFNLDFSRMTL